MEQNSSFQSLEKDYSIAIDADHYLKQFDTENEELNRQLRIERILLGMNVESFVDNWSEESKSIIREYCEKRLEELLKVTDTAALQPLQEPLTMKFKMPKAGEWPLTMKGYPWGTTLRDKKK